MTNVFVSGEATAEVTQATISVFRLLLHVLGGGVVGFLLALCLLALLNFIVLRDARTFISGISRRLPLALAVMGAWVGFNFFLKTSPAEADSGFLASLSHIFLICTIFVVTWLIVGIVNGIVGVIYDQVHESSQSRARRIQTQLQILHRVIIFLIWILGIAAILLTFPVARTAGASLLASAGVFSVIAGLAAQTTLSNLFAGLQLAFSDSIRVGDIVYYKDNYTTVEEITLTYVVLAIWDGRRIIVPSVLLTSQDFENWTRRKPDMIGEVLWEVDWALPIEAARKQLDFLLRECVLWDGQTGILQIKEVRDQKLVMRALISAADSSTLIDLQYYIREKMVLWIQNEAPQAIPRTRYYVDESVNLYESQQNTEQALTKRLQNEASRVYFPSKSAQTPFFQDVTETQIMSVNDILKSEEQGATSAANEVESALFFGSETADERKKNFSGPSEEVYAERNKRITEEFERVYGTDEKNDNE